MEYGRLTKLSMLLYATLVASGLPADDPLRLSSEFIVLANPNRVPAHVALEFPLPKIARKRTSSFTIAPLTRHTVSVTADPTLKDYQGCLKVLSDVPIAAERMTYVDVEGIARGGIMECLGARVPSRTWYFAEGFTADTHHVWLVLTNPLDVAADVTIDYLLPGSQNLVSRHSLEPRGRTVVHVNDIAGLEATELGAVISADSPILAERVLLFRSGRLENTDLAPAGAGNKIEKRKVGRTNLPGRSQPDFITGLHSTMGATSPSLTWYFPDGRASESFKTFIMLLNPSQAEARVSITVLPDGDRYASMASLRLAPRSRAHWKLREAFPGIDGAIVLESDVPIVAERAMYWDAAGHSQRGGTILLGAPAPATDWILTEGFLGKENDLSLILSNPFSGSVQVMVEYLTPQGLRGSFRYPIDPRRRVAIPVRQIPGLDGSEFSIKISADSPIIPERMTWLEAGGVPAATGYTSSGVSSLSEVWYLPQSLAKEAPSVRPAGVKRTTSEF